MPTWTDSRSPPPIVYHYSEDDDASRPQSTEPQEENQEEAEEEVLGKLVENGNFPANIDETEEHTITGYAELPQLDEQFALAIHRS